MNSFYCGCAIEYPVGKLHIGHFFEKIGADVLTRYKAFTGFDAFLLLGLDENTQRVVQAARQAGVDPKTYVDTAAVNFQDCWHQLDIEYSDFIRTSEPRHHVGVSELLNGIYKSGKVYKRNYQGLYCEGCESFKTTKDIHDGKCPAHPSIALIDYEEDNWFFRLSDYKQQLLDLYETGQFQIAPPSRHNEVIAFVQAELQDISISRRNLGWGVPIPWDESQVCYVWADALANYLTGVGFPVSHEQRWPADVLICGKDIARFHCVLLPALLMSYNSAGDGKLAFPKKVFAHGFVTHRGQKIAKSGNFVDPMEIVKEFGCDAYRYYFLSRCDYASDGEYDRDHFIEVYNSDLANNLGNLVSRVISMAIKYFGGKIPNEDKGQYTLGIKPYLNYCKHMEECEYRDVLADIWTSLAEMNVYIDQQAPWKLIKEDKDAAAHVLGNLINGLRATAILLKPLLPQTSRKIYESFTFAKPWEEVDLAYFRHLLYEPKLWELEDDLVVNRDIVQVGKPTPLFQRYEML